MHQIQHSVDKGQPASWYRTRWWMALFGFAAVGFLLLAYEHRLHIPFGNLLVILPLFICIGLHSLMHRGHGGHGDRPGRKTGAAPARPAQDREGETR